MVHCLEMPISSPGVVIAVDRNILPGMKPTRHSFSCGQPLGPGVAHHGMHYLVHHTQTHVTSPCGERFLARVTHQLTYATNLMPILRLFGP